MKTITIKIIQWSDIKQWWINHFGVRTIKENAREQRKIDIDKACEWLRTATQCGVHPCSSNSFVEDFRKAMEE